MISFQTTKEVLSISPWACTAVAFPHIGLMDFWPGLIQPLGEQWQHIALCRRLNLPKDHELEVMGQ
jgi:hypothetical protein